MRRSLSSIFNIDSLAIATLLLFFGIDCAHSFVPTAVLEHRRTVSLSATVQEAGWKYKGHDVHTEVKTPRSSFLLDRSKPTLLLIHGFGCSNTYWRETTAALLEQGYQVHSLDLLGQGKSAKPGRANGIEYSIPLWADLVDSYARENIQGDVVLVGNSLGSLVALSAATGDFATNDDSWLKNRVKGICMFNCGVGLNSRGIANEPQWNPTQRFLINSLYNVLTALIFNNRALLRYVLDEVVTRELLRETLQALYKCDPDRVDDELVESFYLPAKDEGSVEALSQIYCNDPGATPFELHAKYGNFLNELPIHLVWGNDDVVTPLVREGGVGQFYVDLAADEDTNVSFKVVESGHVPFDDNPTVSNKELLKWLEEVVAKDATKAEAFGGLGWLVGR